MERVSWRMAKDTWFVNTGRIVPIIASRQRSALVVNGRPTLSDASILERRQDLLSRKFLHPGSSSGAGPDQQCPLRLGWFQLLSPLSPLLLGSSTPAANRANRRGASQLGIGGPTLLSISGSSHLNIRGAHAGDHCRIPGKRLRGGKMGGSFRVRL